MTDQPSRKQIATVKVPADVKTMTDAEYDAWAEKTYADLREQAKRKAQPRKT